MGKVVIILCVFAAEVNRSFSQSVALQTAAKNLNQGKENFPTVVHGYLTILADICSVFHSNFVNPNCRGKDIEWRKVSPFLPLGIAVYRYEKRDGKFTAVIYSGPAQRYGVIIARNKPTH